jgi:hypothetical protein
MKPLFTDGKLSVELHKPERAVLERAKAIGEALEAMHQEQGAPLVAACVAILEAK